MRANSRWINAHARDTPNRYAIEQHAASYIEASHRTDKANVMLHRVLLG